MVVRSHGSTPRRSGSKMLVLPDGSTEGTVGGGEVENRVVQEALQAIVDGKPRFLEYQMADPGRGDAGVCGGQVEVYVEPIRPKPTIVIIGAGHVGRAVAQLSHWLGYWVVVNDDRAGLCTPEICAECRSIYPFGNGRFTRAIGNQPLDIPGTHHPWGGFGRGGFACFA